MDKIEYILKNGNSILTPVFEGKNIEQMPKLISEKYLPLSLAQIMEQRLRVSERNNAELSNIWDKNYFDSGDGIIYHPDGRIKITPDSVTLKKITPDTKLSWYGSQILEEGTFDKLQGEEFTRDDLSKYTEKYLDESEVLENPIWLAFVRGDKQLLKEYTRYVSLKNNNKKIMRIWISDQSPRFEAERLLSLYGLDYNSNVVGNEDGQLDLEIGRYVAITPNLSRPFSGNERINQANINLELLLKDFKLLNTNGFLTPKAYEFYLDLQRGKYNI